MCSWTGLTALLAAAAINGAAAAATFDLVTYRPPAGWNVDVQGNHVVILHTEQKTFCLISIYESAPAADSLATSFLSQWRSVINAGFGAGLPKETSDARVGTAEAAWGAATILQNGTPVYAQLFVADAGARVVSIVVMTLSYDEYQVYRRWLDPMFESMKIARVAAPAQSTTASGGRLDVPPLRRALTLGDLAGEWDRDDSVVTNYMNYRGDYAGYRSISVREKWTFDGRNGVSKSSYGVALGIGGRQVAEENTTGTVVLSPPRLLTLRWKVGAAPTYIIRGWLELPSLTVLQLNGPYWSTDVPSDVLTDRRIGANLDGYWVRKK